MSCDGDHLITPFECDHSIFVKIKLCLSQSEGLPDKKVPVCIRRINLDVLWSKDSATVVNNLQHAKKMLQCSIEAGLEVPFKSKGPMPGADNFGYEVDI